MEKSHQILDVRHNTFFGLFKCRNVGVQFKSLLSCSSGLRSAQNQGKHKSGQNSHSLCCQILRTASVQNGLALLPDPEGGVLPDDGVVEPEFRVVGEVVRCLPLCNDGVLEGGILVGEAAVPDGMTVEWLYLGNI